MKIKQLKLIYILFINIMFVYTFMINVPQRMMLNVFSLITQTNINIYSNTRLGNVKKIV